MLHNDIKASRFILAALSFTAIMSSLACILVQTDVAPYIMREATLYTIIPMVMIAALGVFVLLEENLPYVNKRAFVWNVFLTQTFVSLLCYLFTENSLLSVFALREMNMVVYISEIVFVIRVLLLLLIPFARKWVVKVYCLAMVACLAVAFLAVVFDLGLVERYTFRSVLLIVADLFFYGALYSFADVMTDDNKWKIPLPFLNKFFGVAEDEEDSQASETKYWADYWLVRLYALNEKKDDFAKTDVFFERLSKGILWDEQHQYYSTEEYVTHLSVLKDLIDEIQERWKGYLSPLFAFSVDLLLANTDSYMFKADVVTAAGLFLGDPMNEPNWTYITDRHDMYMEAIKTDSQENVEGDEE